MDSPGTGSEYILDALVAEGVDTLFGVIGEGNAHLIDAVNDRAVQFVQARHEQAGVTMADGAARAKKGVTACTLTHGPGVTNGATGIAAADRDNVPIVVLVGDTGIEGRETSLQYLDHATFASPISAYQTRIESVPTIPEVLSRAFDRARTRSGPVLVEVPADVQEGDAPDEPYAPTDRPPQRVRPDTDLVADAAARIDEAERPVVLAGGGAMRSDAGDLIAAFAAQVGAPVATTYFGRAVLPESHELVSGIAGTFMSPANDALLWDADVVVALGARLSGKSTRYGELYADAEVIQVDVDEEAIGIHRDPAIGIVADARETVAELRARTEANPERAERVAETIANAPSPWADGFEERVDEIDPREFTLELSERVPDDAIVTVGSGNNTGFPAVFHDLDAGGSMLMNGNFGTMGYSLPAALGAKAAAPDRPVVCYTGDGALIQVVQEIETGVRLGLPIVIAVFNDRSYGIIRHRQNYVYDRETDSSYDSPDFVGIAEGFGAEGAVIRSPGDLEVVTEYLSSDPDVPLVLDARTIPDIARPGFPPY
jgi:acetolactate synthase I/II/III large subunit